MILELRTLLITKMCLQLQIRLCYNQLYMYHLIIEPIHCHWYKVSEDSGS